VSGAWSRPAGSVPFRPRTARRPATVLVSLLLLMSGDVEINPGPMTPVNTVNELLMLDLLATRQLSSAT